MAENSELDAAMQRSQAERARKASDLKSRLSSGRPSSGRARRVTNAEITQKVLSDLMAGVGGQRSDKNADESSGSSESEFETISEAQVSHVVESANDADAEPIGDENGSDGVSDTLNNLVNEVFADNDRTSSASAETDRVLSELLHDNDSHVATDVVNDTSDMQDLAEMRASAHEADLTVEEKTQRGMFAWAEALASFYETVADDADVARAVSQDTHVPSRSFRKAGSRGGRAAASDASPVQVRGVSRPLFQIVADEFPELKNKDALEAYIAKHSGRFDLIKDDTIRMAAMKSSAEDGSIAGLANEVASLRRAVKAVSIEASVAALSSVMNDVDIRSDDLSDQLFLRMRDLVTLASAYDEAIRQANGRLPSGYD